MSPALEASSPRNLTKCVWRCSRVKPLPSSVEALMQATQQIRQTFHLSEAEHRLVCEEAMRLGEPLATHYFCEMELSGKSWN